MVIKSNLLNIIITHKYGLATKRSWPSYARHLCSSGTKGNVLNKPNNDSSESPSREFQINQSQFAGQSNESYNTGFVEPVRINSLNIVRNIETLHKNGSIFYNYFLGTYDKDLLSYPTLLKTRKEFHLMNDQYEMIRQTWSKIKKDNETLDLLGYHSLYNLSVSEMMFIFEAIGAGEQKHFAFGSKEDKEYRFENKMNRSFNVTHLNSPVYTEPSLFKTFDDTRQTIHNIMPLILKNSLVYYALYNSPNSALKESILNEKAKIGLAYCENAHSQMNDLSNWSTEAKLTSNLDSWVVSGEKCGIMKDDYSHYLLICKTSEFTEKQPFIESNDKSGIVALLIKSDQVEVNEDTSDYFGIEYQKIKFKDVKLARDSSEVIQSHQNLTNFLNVKGCGQIATSAIILGLLKQLLKNTYANLINNKIGLLNSELIQYKLYQATRNIYAIESMLYMTAAMFDSFEPGASIAGESMAVKSLTAEYAYDVITDLKSIFGSRYPFSSTALDLIHLLDTMLGSSIQNRISIGQNAIKHYKTYNNLGENFKTYATAPIYSVKRYLKFKKIQERDLFPPGEMNKYIHHNLHVACQWIENVIMKLECSTNYLVNYHKENIMEKHVDLNRIASMSMDIFMMICVLSRANHSMCYGRRNNDTEKELCMAICKEMFIKHVQTFEDITRETMSNNDQFARNIFQANLKENGYFPSIFDHQFDEN